MLTLQIIMVRYKYYSIFKKKYIQSIFAPQYIYRIYLSINQPICLSTYIPLFLCVYNNTMNYRILKASNIFISRKDQSHEGSIYLSIYLEHKPVESIMYWMYLYLGRTSLMYAAWNGNTDTVKILLEHGAEVNTKDNSG